MIKCERGSTNPPKMQQKTATNILWYGKCLCLLHCMHLYSWRRITQTIYIPSKNTEDLTMKQMFDISEKLISEQSDEIHGVTTINWEDSSWKHLSLVGGEKVISLSTTKVYVFFQILCYALERWTRTHNQIMHVKTGCVNSTPHTSQFLVFHSHILMSHWHWLKFGVCRALQFIPSSCAHDAAVLILSTTLPSTLCFPSSLSSSFSFSCSSPSSSMMWETRTLRTLANEDLGTLAENDPLTSTSLKNW